MKSKMVDLDVSTILYRCVGLFCHLTLGVGGEFHMKMPGLPYQLECPRSYFLRSCVLLGFDWTRFI